jgi:hypothetical protein
MQESDKLKFVTLFLLAMDGFTYCEDTVKILNQLSNIVDGLKLR